MSRPWFLFPVLIILTACNSSPNNVTIATDTAAIEAGRVLFEKNCVTCHSFERDEIGPALGAVTERVSVHWLKQFVKDPAGMMQSDDTIAAQLRKRYQATMPSFSQFSDSELNNIIAYMHTHSSPPQRITYREGAIRDPIPEKIQLSNLVVNIKEVARFPASSKDGKYPLTRITKLAAQPGSGDLFVNDLRGKLYKLKNGKPVVFLDISSLRPAFIDEPGLGSGFGSFAFHPQFSKNGLFYTTHTEKPATAKADFTYNDTINVEEQWVLTEWKMNDVNSDTFSGTSRELLRANMVSYAHGIQEIAFNPNVKPGAEDFGLLYIGIGDGSSVQLGFPFITRGKNKIWGAVLRVDPLGTNSANGKYGIPANNPFVKDKDPNTKKEIYAYGFRNPHRITWTKANEMLVSNIGQTNIESLEWIRPGGDYGWPAREGSFLFDPNGNLDNVFPLTAGDSSHGITYPVAQFDHDEGSAICGGYEYSGRNIPELEGKFLFGDIPSGRLFYINTADIHRPNGAPIQEWKITIDHVPATLKQVCGSSRVDLHFGMDGEGELYILTKSDGKLYKIEGASIKQ
jgi:glucose/arabinose dehydrogenase/mono/diheme cytochrome c family protein